MGVKLISLLFQTKSSYEQNLKILLALINSSPDNSIIVAPELCITGFDYDNIYGAANFSKKIISKLKIASLQKTVIFTMFEKIDGEIFNRVKIFHNGELVLSRAKARLFRFGGEEKYMSEGSDSEFEIIELDGVKIAVLICFELRFRSLIQKCEGADVIAIPTWWGVLRSEHYKVLTQSLAIMNQCYVIASDSLNDECTKLSAIINPKGEVSFNGNKPCLEVEYNKKEITLMRRYIDIGIK